MLNTAEKFQLLKFINSCCSFGCLPVVIDLLSWKLLPHSAATTGIKRWLNSTYFGFFVLHSLYKIATLLVTLFQHTRPPLHELIIHAVLALCGMAAIFWYYELFVKNSGAFGIFLHITLTGNIGGMRTADAGRPQESLVGRLKEYSVQDLIAIGLPFMVVPVFVAGMGLYIYYPTLDLLLYAGVPGKFQGPFTFGVLLLEEMRYFLMIWAVALPMFMLQIIAFDLVNNQLESLIGIIASTKSKRELLHTYARLRHFQLYVIIINVVNRFIIFSWKTLCIGVCIGAGYAAIAHFSDYPIFGVMYCFVLVDETFIYIVSYDKAFQVPGLCKQAQQLCLLRLHQGGRGVIRMLKRQMRSIPRFGIKVGEFHVLERQSTPEFVHFVLSHVVTMLVAYNH